MLSLINWVQIIQLCTYGFANLTPYDLRQGKRIACLILKLLALKGKHMARDKSGGTPSSLEFQSHSFGGTNSTLAGILHFVISQVGMWVECQLAIIYGVLILSC